LSLDIPRQSIHCGADFAQLFGRSHDFGLWRGKEAWLRLLHRIREGGTGFHALSHAHKTVRKRAIAGLCQVP